MSDSKVTIMNQKIKVYNSEKTQYSDQNQFNSETKYVIALQQRSDSSFVKQSSSKKPQQKSNVILDPQQNINSWIIKLSFESFDLYSEWLINLNPICYTDCQLTSHYDVLSKIGQGNFAQVYLAKVTPASIYYGIYEQVAVKRIAKKTSNHANTEQLKQELQTMQDLRFNKNVVRILQIFETEKSVHLVMEYIKDGTLYQYIRSNEYHLQRDTIEILIGQLINVVKEIHDAGYIHRDLKPLNVLINIQKIPQIISQNDEKVKSEDIQNKCSGSHIINYKEYPQIKIADFGLSDKIERKEQKLDVICGTPGFMAPEILNGFAYDQSSDVFSLGCLLYFILTGTLLIKGNNFDNVMKNNKDFFLGNQEFLALSEWGLSKSDWRFLIQFLQDKPSQRCPLSHIIEDSWLNNFKTNLSLRCGEIDKQNLEASLTQKLSKQNEGINQKKTNVVNLLDQPIHQIQCQNQVIGIQNDEREGPCNDFGFNNYNNNIVVDDSDIKNKQNQSKLNFQQQNDSTQDLLQNRFTNLEQLLKQDFNFKNILIQKLSKSKESETNLFANLDIKRDNVLLKNNLVQKDHSENTQNITYLQKQANELQINKNDIKQVEQTNNLQYPIKANHNKSFDLELLEDDTQCNIKEYEFEINQLTDIIAFVPVLNNKDKQMSNLNGPLIKQSRLFVQ
eukprot:403351835